MPEVCTGLNKEGITKIILHEGYPKVKIEFYVEKGGTEDSPVLSPPFFGVAGSLSFSNTQRVASHKTMEVSTLKGEKLFHLEDAVFLLWIFGVTVIPFLTWLLRNNRILVYLPITCELLLLCFAVWFFYGRERRREDV